LVGVNTLYIGDYQTHSLQYKRGENTFIDITLNAKLEEVVAEIDTTQATFTPNEEFDGISKIEINAQPVFDNGFNSGFESGSTEGFENGYSSGRTDGYTEGYEVGERTGVNEFVNGLPSLTITQNGVYNETNKGVTVNVQTVDNSYFTGNVDESGLREIGWDDADIANFRDNINIYSWQNESYKVSDANKALYGVINANNIGDYANDPNLVYLPKFDGELKKGLNLKYVKAMPLINMSNNTNANSMFEGYSSLLTMPPINMRNFVSSALFFNNCSNLQSLPFLDTSNITNMNLMFGRCSSLQAIPLLNTSNVTNMYSMFQNCGSLKDVPLLDTSKVENMQGMFFGCGMLQEIPSFNTVKVKTFKDFLNSGWGSLRKIGVLQAQSVTEMRDFFGFTFDTSNITDIGGFIGLNCNWNDSYGLAICKNLSYQSCINILNGLADVTELGGRTLKVHSNFLTTVGDEISIGTNKGWTITA
jgi:surface protein